jgi:hypothetical protein
VRRLVEAYHPERIYLFGSKARGDAGPDSDFDLMVIVSDDAPPGDAAQPFGVSGTARHRHGQPTWWSGPSRVSNAEPAFPHRFQQP